jgi:hypothetical protein
VSLIVKGLVKYYFVLIIIPFLFCSCDQLNEENLHNPEENSQEFSHLESIKVLVFTDVIGNSLRFHKETFENKYNIAV